MTLATLTDIEARSLISIVGDGVHSEKVLEWRKDQFQRMGYVEYLSEYLASTRIDIWEMRRLIEEKGCPAELAPAILVGTMWSGEDPQVQWVGEKDWYVEETKNSDKSDSEPGTP